MVRILGDIRHWKRMDDEGGYFTDTRLESALSGVEEYVWSFLCTSTKLRRYCQVGTKAVDIDRWQFLIGPFISRTVFQSFQYLSICRIVHS